MAPCGVALWRSAGSNSNARYTYKPYEDERRVADLAGASSKEKEDKEEPSTNRTSEVGLFASAER